MLFPYIFIQHKPDKYRDQGQGKDQSAKKGKAQGPCQGREHFPFHFLEREDGHQAENDDEFGKEYGPGHIDTGFTYHPRFGKQVECRHPYGLCLTVKDHEQTFDHHHSAVNNDPEVNCSHRQQVRRHPHQVKPDKCEQ